MSEKREMRVETCGMCRGRGWYYGSTFDRLGHQVHDFPPEVTCEYCGGRGRCEDGHLLLAALEPAARETE